MIKCPMCNHSFSEDEGRAACAGCPLGANCGMIRCPNCNYDIPKQSRLLAIIKRIRRQKDGAN